MLFNSYFVVVNYLLVYLLVFTLNSFFELLDKLNFPPWDLFSLAFFKIVFLNMFFFLYLICKDNCLQKHTFLHLFCSVCHHNRFEMKHLQFLGNCSFVDRCKHLYIVVLWHLKEVICAYIAQSIWLRHEVAH